jgi:hypothetical protein
VNFEASITIPASCDITVAGYTLNALPMIQQKSHPCGMQSLLEVCGKDASYIFALTHPHLPFEKLSRYFSPKNTQRTKEQYDAHTHKVRGICSPLADPITPACKKLARFVPKLSSGRPQQGRYDADVVSKAKLEWMKSMRDEKFPCVFAKTIAIKQANFGFGVYHDNIHGIAAFLEDIYTYLDALPELYRSDQYLSAFVVQVPDALRKVPLFSRKNSAVLDEHFARFVKRFIEKARKLDSLIAGLGHTRWAAENDDGTFDFGTASFAVQAGHPRSQRKSRIHLPYPTIVFVPTQSLIMRDKLHLESVEHNHGEGMLFSEAIHKTQVIEDKSINPIPELAEQQELYPSCVLSGFQDVRALKREGRYCPIRLHPGKLSVQSCITSASDFKKKPSIWDD